jgi:hypothetical protein
MSTRKPAIVRNLPRQGIAAKMGTVYVRLGQFADAIPILQKAAPSDHHGDVHYHVLGVPEAGPICTRAERTGAFAKALSELFKNATRPSLWVLPSRNLNRQ